MNDFNFSPNIPITGTPISFVHTHANHISKVEAFYPSKTDLVSLCSSPYSHAYLVVPDDSIIKMTRDPNIATLSVESSEDDVISAIFAVKISGISGSVKKTTKSVEMNLTLFEKAISDAYQFRVKWLWWAPYLW